MTDGPEVLTERDVRMAWPLGQLGVNAYPHTPRAVTGLEDVVRPVPPFVVVPRRAVLPVDGAPASVGQLERREAGAAFYWAALWFEGAATRKGPRTAQGEEGRVEVPPLDRWLLEETIVVVWDRPGDERGLRMWIRRGRGKWTVKCTWRRPAGGVLVMTRGAG